MGGITAPEPLKPGVLAPVQRWSVLHHQGLDPSFPEASVSGSTQNVASVLGPSVPAALGLTRGRASTACLEQHLVTCAGRCLERRPELDPRGRAGLSSGSEVAWCCGETIPAQKGSLLAHGRQEGLQSERVQNLKLCHQKLFFPTSSSTLFQAGPLRVEAKGP